jgi:hypothetical protein
MRRYRFTRIWARLMVATGVLFLGLGVVLAAVALVTEEWRQGVTGMEAFERTVVVGGLLLSGFLAGSPFIVFGQLLEIFLDQRRLLARIHRQLRRPTAEPAPRQPADQYPRLSG